MKATEESWQHSRMPGQREQMALDRRYTASEYEHLAEGEIPRVQDDRWFIWVGDDHVVHVHRSWTGFEIYEVRLQPCTDGYEVAEAWVNGDPAQYERNPGMDVALLGPMLDRLAGR